MKNLFIPAISKKTHTKEDLEKISKKLPKSIAIAYSIQYKSQALKIKEFLEEKHKITSLIQVLGCSKPSFSKSTQAILIISDGKFHATSLALETKIPVYLYNIHDLTKISEKNISNLEKKRKSSYLNYLNSEKVGILISTKPGQQKLSKALKLKIPKTSYLFLTNNIDIQEFENFPQIKSWINTACPRLDLDSNKVINLGDLNEAGEI